MAVVPPKPNIIVVLMDDLDFKTMDAFLEIPAHTDPGGGYTFAARMRFMRQSGMEFRRTYCSAPLCAPNRASFLRGQYLHNHGVGTNPGGWEKFSGLVPHDLTVQFPFNDGERTPGGHRNDFENADPVARPQPQNVGIMMQRGGYQTAWLGKYLNSYDGRLLAGSPGQPDAVYAVPGGWDFWNVFQDRDVAGARGGDYYDYTLLRNDGPGTAAVALARGQADADYSTDVLRDDAASNMGAVQVFNRIRDAGAPAFVVTAPFNPHITQRPSIPGKATNFLAVPAPRHLLARVDVGRRGPGGIVPTSSTPPPGYDAYNETTLSTSLFGGDDKPRFVRVIKPFTDTGSPQPPNGRIYGPTGQSGLGGHAYVSEAHNSRVRALYAVDDLVTNLYDAVAARGELDNTYFFLTSDNGFQGGEHRIILGKDVPYEESIRIPLIVFAPSHVAPSVIRAIELVSTNDLMPTFGELAGLVKSHQTTSTANIPAYVDGRSITPLFPAVAGPWTRKRVLSEGSQRAFIIPGSGGQTQALSRATGLGPTAGKRRANDLFVAMPTVNPGGSPRVYTEWYNDETVPDATNTWRAPSFYQAPIEPYGDTEASFNNGFDGRRTFAEHYRLNDDEDQSDNAWDSSGADTQTNRRNRMVEMRGARKAVGTPGESSALVLEDRANESGEPQPLP